MSAADICRRNGWGVGTRLVGVGTYDTVTIVITAIGEGAILARHVGGLGDGHEGPWCLDMRDWTVAP